MSTPLLGGVEAGGTKFLCLVGEGPGRVLAEERIATTTPAATLARVIEFFRVAERAHGAVAAFGLASFGPLDLDRASPTWGFLTTTPKAGWSDTDLVGPFVAAFSKPVALETDVHGAGLAEVLWGAGRGSRSLVYVTVGTGIGGGVIVDGRPLPGCPHPEMGHVRLPRHPADGDFAGVCPFHGDCLEGLASGPAVVARWGRRLDELPSGHQAFEVLGFYLGHLCALLTLVVSPHRIILGGGLMAHPALLATTRAWTSRHLAGYPQTPRLAAGLEDYLVPPALGQRAGGLGALALARMALSSELG